VTRDEVVRIEQGDARIAEQEVRRSRELGLDKLDFDAETIRLRKVGQCQTISTMTPPPSIVNPACFIRSSTWASTSSSSSDIPRITFWSVFGHVFESPLWI
jgi:hypothetical protein